MYDLLLKGGHVVDPANNRNGRFDIAIRDGRIARISPDIARSEAAEVLDVSGLLVLPGLVDIHVHASSEFQGPVAHRMLALAGVTTAMDMAGPIDDVLAIAREHGAGINLACLNRVKPGEMVDSADPSAKELRDGIAAALDRGALGVKIMGGHFPLTPEANGRVFEIANELGAWAAIHCGSTENRSDLTGLREALDLKGRNHVHIAHINSYCRGAVKDPQLEAIQAIEWLTEAQNLVTESYLAVINGTSGICIDGIPESDRTRACLQQGGYPATEEGLRRAILEGFGRVNVIEGDRAVLRTGPEAVAVWEAAGTNVGISFPVNPPMPRLMLAAARDRAGRFVVDALATDGGGIPRNFTISAGLRLVELEVLTMADFVLKACTVPARLLGLTAKGHLGEGADADVAVVDAAAAEVRTTIAAGQVVAHHGVVTGRSTRIITLERGRKAVEAAGLQPIVTDLAESGFYKPHTA